MNTNQRTNVVFIILVSLVLTGCGPGQLFGPPLLNDEEFAESARGVYSNLKTDFDSLNPIDFTSKADVYSRAADALDDLEISEQSAPQGARLRSGLSKLAVSYDMFDKALNEALSKANIEGSFNLMITEGGSVFVTSGGDWATLQELEIETDLYLELKAAQTLIQDAAIALGLEDCIPEQSGDDG